MKNFRILPLFHVALFLVMGMTMALAQAADDDAFLGKVLPPLEQTVGRGHTALWTLSQVATQYQPPQPTPAMQQAIQAQDDGRFIEALTVLEKAAKDGQASEDVRAETNLLRASFLLQGGQSAQALELLTPLQAYPRLTANAYALTAMARLKQGQTQEALEAAQRAQNVQGEEKQRNLLPQLAMSYVQQGSGQLAEAQGTMHEFNKRGPQQAVALAREAELALTLDEVSAARSLVAQAQTLNAAHPYIVSVAGLVRLIDGQAQDAKTAFEIALKRDPFDARALLGLGLAEIKLGHFKQGLEKLQAAKDSDPYNALTLTYLGRAQQQDGQTSAAMASWRRAQQIDPQDPVPWLYQAQAELQANHPQDARESLRQAQARLASRSVYRGERLLREDTQLLQANLAEAQRLQGLDALAFYTLADGVGEKNSANLRNQADALQGQRFGESARRSLLLQSMFDAKPGNLPAELDIYGDGAGLTGGATPQHGEISSLGAQQASYNNYDDLFTPAATLAADATAGSQNNKGEQVRLGVGSDKVGVNLAQRNYKTDGFGPFNNLNNRVWQGTVQWRPSDSTQLFVSRLAFHSLHGETRYPADLYWTGEYHQIQDNSGVTRLGLRQSLGDNSELRALVSRQQSDQRDNFNWIANTPPYSTITLPNGMCCGPTLPFPQRRDYSSSKAQGGELQYRRSGAGYATQWGVSAARLAWDTQWGQETIMAQQIYADWQQALNPAWQLETGLAWNKSYVLYTTNTYLRRWMPKLGLVYTQDSATHVRLAAWKGLDNAAVGDASLQPATLAGIALRRTGEGRQLVRSVVLGADKQLDAAWLLEGQVQRRWIDDPNDAGNGALLLLSNRVDTSRLALHWQPGPLNVTLAYDDERFRDDNLATAISNSLQRQHLRSQQLGLRWLASEQWTADITWSRNWVAAQQQATDLNNIPALYLIDVQDRYNQTDASLSWQFSRMGSVEMSVRNIGGKGSRYTEIDPLVPRFSKGRLSYAKLKLLW